jgi:hypothetical protein
MPLKRSKMYVERDGGKSTIGFAAEAQGFRLPLSF